LFGNDSTVQRRAGGNDCVSGSIACSDVFRQRTVYAVGNFGGQFEAHLLVISCNIEIFTAKGWDFSASPCLGGEN
jgi:hypothetical protein